MRADFPLEGAGILDRVGSRKVHRSTRYLVFERELDRGAKEHAIVELRTAGRGFFRSIEHAEVLALPPDIGHVIDSSVNVHNHISVSRATKDVDRPFIVVEGEFDHVTFERREDPVRITVLDVVPPHPGKLPVLVGRAAEVMTLTVPVKIDIRVIDMDERVKALSPSRVIYPCRVSRVDDARDVVFLQDDVDVDDTMVMMACDMSRKMVLSRYKKRPRLVNMCPCDLADELGLEGPHIVKCCKLEGEVRVEPDKQRVTVPWGVKMEELWEAIRACISFSR